MATRSTRLLKAICGDCAYTVRVTRRWLDLLGAPLCPCNRQPLECAEWEEIREARAQETRAYARSLAVESRVLQSRWKHARVVHTCTLCWREIAIGEEYHAKVMRVGGELLVEKRCLACQCRMTEESRTGLCSGA